MNKLVVYSTPTCQPCKTTKARLDDEGIEYESVDLTENAEALARLKERLGSPVVNTPMFSFAGALCDIRGLRDIILKIKETRAA